MKIFEIITEAAQVDPELIQKIKELWDSGITSPTQIGSQLGLTKQDISRILFRYYQDRPNKQKWTLTPELVNQVKNLWDSGVHSGKQIAKELGISITQSNDILDRFYRDRPNKQEQTLTPELIQKVKELWNSGMTSASKIAATLEISKQQVSNILIKYYPDRPDKRTIGEFPTSEMIPTIVSMYKNGQVPSSIKKILKLEISITGIVRLLASQPNWDEIRAEHLDNRRPRRQKAATTNKTPAGEIGTQSYKGPRSRHTAGRRLA